MTTTRDLIIYAGQSFAESLTYAGTAGRGQRMHIRASDAAADVIAILTHNGDANARVIYDGTDSLDITIGASVNGGWLVGANRVEWVYDIEDYDLSDADDVVIAYRGKCIVYGNRTRPEDVTPSAALPSGDGRYVRFDTDAQGLSDAQKLAARTNIGVTGGGGGGSGDVVGPVSATDDRISAFDGTTGKLIKQGTVTATAVASHLSSTSNPHSTTAAQVGADPAGTAASAVSTHNAVTSGAHGMTAFGASLVDDADASAARTTLGLGTAATAATGDFATASHTHAASDVTSGTFDAARLPAASETALGAVELATTAEALTGTDTARAVTPAGVKAVADTKAATSHTHAASDITSGTLDAARLPAATTTASGAVELATVAECQAGTDTTRATTPEGVAAAIAALASGASPGGSSGQLQYNNASAFGGAPLWREDANTITQRNGTSAQAGRWANTWTDSSNYELGRAQWVSNVFTIGTIKAGTGVARGLALQVDGVNVVSWNAGALQATFAFQTNHSADMNFSGLGQVYSHRHRVTALASTSYTFATADCGGTILVATSGSDQNWTVPASPGAGTHIGVKVSTAKSSYLRITANTGQKIRLAGGLSASAGYVRSNVAGSFLWLIYDSTDAEWVAWQQGGTWTIDS